MTNNPNNQESSACDDTCTGEGHKGIPCAEFDGVVTPLANNWKFSHVFVGGKSIDELTENEIKVFNESMKNHGIEIKLKTPPST